MSLKGMLKSLKFWGEPERPTYAILRTDDRRILDKKYDTFTRYAENEDTKEAFALDNGQHVVHDPNIGYIAIYNESSAKPLLLWEDDYPDAKVELSADDRTITFPNRTTRVLSQEEYDLKMVADQATAAAILEIAEKANQTKQWWLIAIMVGILGIAYLLQTGYTAYNNGETKLPQQSAPVTPGQVK